ncbi:hypothetical protein, partial [Acetobacter sicerae]|uniref:hypothetical protein n=1 Tax=Acetobacter sicerae TaxID=85325 RepID=UPI00156B7AA0
TTMTALNYALTHHDWPMAERAAGDLVTQNAALLAENDRLWVERNAGLAAIRDRDTELDIAREHIARPVTLIIAPAIGRWFAGLPMTTADAIQIVLDWVDGQIERVPEAVTIPARATMGVVSAIAMSLAFGLLVMSAILFTGSLLDWFELVSL